MGSTKGQVYIVTGVSGSGKTTVGMALAQVLGGAFYDGDSFHPETNIAKMKAGAPLTDADRQPWLEAINHWIKERLPRETLFIACSALKEKYRDLLEGGIDSNNITWVHLQGSYELIDARMRQREGHFMPPALLHSQMEAYEMPIKGIIVDIDQQPDQIIDQIIAEIENPKSDVGLIGLGVMGTSLARNIASKGFSISLYNRHVQGKEEGIAKNAVAKYQELQLAKPFDELGYFVASLRRPRKIILMVNAGKPVDDVVQKLIPLLQAGDVVVDGGNSHYTETEARQLLLADKKIQFVGTGVSGGEEGALLGPSIMPGGSKQGFDQVKEILMAIAAKNSQGETCCDYIGEGGSGHFIKMVHNGIEYAEMQLIAECYSHLRYDQHHSLDAIAGTFEKWNSGEAASYLLGITSTILRHKDADGLPLIDKIADEARSKGTGSWASISACELGVPIPAITEALFARYLSAFKHDRTRLSQIYRQENQPILIEIENLLHTYQFCRIIIHYQGFKLIEEASAKFGWDIDSSVLLKIWSGGCIIRSTLLSLLGHEWETYHTDLLEHTYCKKLIQDNLVQIKETIAKLAMSHQPYAVAASCLDYFKGLTSARSQAYLIQAQRDFFGAHTYQRTDDPTGSPHHTIWG